MAKGKKKAKRSHLRGYAHDIHGAFTSEAAAKRKARAVGGYYIKRYARFSKPRYVVLTNPKNEVPF